MAVKFKGPARIISQEQIASDVYSMWIECEAITAGAGPGQFVSLYTNDSGKLLPRPISICEIDRAGRALRLVYRVTAANSGTEQFSRLKRGDQIEVMGPLGNGFPLGGWRKSFLIGGGIGIPPMIELARQLAGEKQIIAGYRDELFLIEELKMHGAAYIATEDGSVGTRGNVLDAIEEHGLDAEVIYACGPAPMLRAVKAYAETHNIECYVSLEERMACGIGACLACVCQTSERDIHSNVNNKRICKEGPVFPAREVEL